MADTPLVSVVVIFLNEERFLAAAIESVLAQTYAAWELLLVDDGSSDGSTGLAQRWAADQPGRIRYLDHPNHANIGKSASRNLGIRAATGEYVTFLDADDVFLPDKLERQVPLLAARPEAIMVYGRTQYWYSWNRPTPRSRDVVPVLGIAADTVFDPPVLLTHFLDHPRSVPCICSVVARRTWVVAVGGFDESIQQLFEDQVFLAKMCLAGPVLTDAGWGERYRQHPDSSSQVAIRLRQYHPRRPNEAQRAYLEWLERYAGTLPVPDPAFHRALRRALRPYRIPGWALVSPIFRGARTVFRYAVAMAKGALLGPPDVRAGR